MIFKEGHCSQEFYLPIFGKTNSFASFLKGQFIIDVCEIKMSDQLEAYILKLARLTNEVIKKLGLKGEATIQEVTKKSTLSDFCVPVFKLAKANGKNPIELAKQIASEMPQDILYLEVKAEGGFVNFKLNRQQCSREILMHILREPAFYKSKLYHKQRIMVEHTSANPNGPIHIGNFRGSIIGDTYARILKAVGAEVKTHFYVDDLGHQIPVVVIGYQQLNKHKKVKPKEKIDHFLGKIYGITHTIYDIQKLKQELKEKYQFIIPGTPYWLTKEELIALDSKEAKERIPIQELKEYQKNFKFIFEVQEDIYRRFPALYDDLLESIQKDRLDLPTIIPELNRKYIQQEKEAVAIVRSTCQKVIDGQKEELALFNIFLDQFDWEGELQWSGKVDFVLKQLEQQGYLIKDGKARIFNANKAASLEGARSYLKLKDDYEVPKAILVTSSGDPLYLLRDIAYSIDKVDRYKMDRVFNVIGKPQELTQKHLNLALRALGRSDIANKIVHLNYEYMELKGALTRMSARRLQYITPLELFLKTKKAVLETFLEERDYPEEEKEEIATTIAIGAIKYSIIAIGLMKKMIFNPEEVISLNANTSTFIQYAYARTQNILIKTDFSWKASLARNLAELQEDEEWAVIMALAKFPKIIQTAAKQIKPELVCSYLYDLANLYNKFYDSHRVLDAPTKALQIARLALTFATGVVLSQGLALLGIPSPKRM
ncbi:MAG: hypothetical protein DRP02_10260 [Candidatus Gerdarchaeota archaeon]|nr:MAG: hypothetical protein DRO63_06115 [Candidatus Gerdarchaeota archaeon]RLI69567.1 MAG: hypothetical protein DRP02_10260 [Candidatus Gerdarchaeota archaeon]